MQRLWPLLLLVIPLHAIHAQEVKHAPTVEQCRADQRLWMSKVETDSDVVSISFTDLSSWADEIDDCEKVDPDSRYKYLSLESEIAYTKISRFRKFLKRHDLLQQFLAEDAQGKR